MLTDGMISGEAGQPSGHEPLVPWWSFSKTVLAAAALALVDDRKLNLDERVAGAPYTLRHLLGHRSGLRDYGPIAEYHAAVAAREEPWSPEELLKRVRPDALLFEPGTAFAYSNVGYMFVRWAIERATDLNLNDSLRTLVFEPLEVDGVFVATTVADLDRTAWGNERRYDPRWVYHGLAVGGPVAAASFLHRLLTTAFLSPPLKAAMLDAVLVDEVVGKGPAVAPSYGLGLMIDPRSPVGRVIGHTGQGPGSTSAVYSFPDLEKPRTLAAFIPDDGAEAQDALVTHLLSRA